jgi:hypothetical protein
MACGLLGGTPTHTSPQALTSATGEAVQHTVSKTTC